MCIFSASLVSNGFFNFVIWEGGVEMDGKTLIGLSQLSSSHKGFLPAAAAANGGELKFFFDSIEETKKIAIYAEWTALEKV